MLVKTPEEIEIIRKGGHHLAKILEKIVQKTVPGVSTLELDEYAEDLIIESGGRPSFKGYRVAETDVLYPASICASVNDEVVHAIPRRDRVLGSGDIISLDIGMEWPYGRNKIPHSGGHGLYTDMAITVGIGKISADAERLIKVTRQSLLVGIRAIRPGARIGDIGAAVEAHLKKNNLGIIRDLAGHGVGHELHEEPLIPNFGKQGTGIEICEGMVLAIEPMATLGGWRITLDRDEWTFRTKDGSLAAHFEHTIAVTRTGADILTPIT